MTETDIPSISLRDSTRSIFWITAVFLWVVAFAVGGVFYYRENVFKAEGVNASLQSRAAQVLEALDLGQTPIQAVKAATQGSDSVRVTVLDRRGRVVFDTQGIPPGTDHSDRREVRLAMSGRNGYTLSRHSTASAGGSYFYSARSGNGGYIVRTSLPYTPQLNQGLEGETAYLMAAAVMALILTVIAFFAARQLGGRLNRNVASVLQSSQAKLRRQEREREQMKSRLTANINHELKNPVHAVSACLDTLNDNIERLSPEQVHELCKSGQKEARRLADLIDDIGTLTRLSERDMSPLKKQSFNLSEIVREIAQDAVSLSQTQSMRLHNQLPDQLPVTGDRKLLASVFRNLIDNALRHSSGRDLWIKLEKETSDSLTFSVEDNGIGIPEEHRPHIFERFYRVDAGRSRANGGTGLGLAIVKNALLAHGGSIFMESRAGGGARFVFTISKN